MKNYLILFIFSLSSLASTSFVLPKLHSTDLIPADARIEVTIKTIKLAARMDDHNTFFLGDDDFEMIMTLGYNEHYSFPLAANYANRPKHHTLNYSFDIPVHEINSNIKKRVMLEKQFNDLKNADVLTKIGHLCMLDDSLLTPSFLTTSYYGCFDLASTLQKMNSVNQEIKYLQIEKETTFPKPKDPKKSKKIKVLYEVRLIK